MNDKLLKHLLRYMKYEYPVEMCSAIEEFKDGKDMVYYICDGVGVYKIKKSDMYLDHKKFNISEEQKAINNITSGREYEDIKLLGCHSQNLKKVEEVIYLASSKKVYVSAAYLELFKAVDYLEFATDTEMLRVINKSGEIIGWMKPIMVEKIKG